MFSHLVVIFMCVEIKIINFSMKIIYWKEIEVHTCVGDQGGLESQPLPCQATAAGHRAVDPRHRAVGPSG